MYRPGPMRHPSTSAATCSAMLLLALTAFVGCTPKLGEEVPLGDLFTKAELDGKYVTTTGLVRISTGIVASTSCTTSTCTIDLWLPEGEKNAVEKRDDVRSLQMEVAVGSGENEMAELPDKYSKADLKVKAMGGRVLVHGDKVKVSGKLHCKNGSEPSLPCKIRVDRIDAP
jgi:hypothetical protein